MPIAASALRSAKIASQATLLAFIRGELSVAESNGHLVNAMG